MAVIRISFPYEKEKIDILKTAAKADERTTSGYIQKVLMGHVKSFESKKISSIKKAKKLKRRVSNG